MMPSWEDAQKEAQDSLIAFNQYRSQFKKQDTVCIAMQADLKLETDSRDHIKDNIDAARKRYKEAVLVLNETINGNNPSLP